MALSSVSRSIRLHLIVGAAAVALLTAGVGGWAATTEFAGAVIASGNIVVKSNHKKVQHPTGGVIAELLVRNGDQVKAGQLLVKLDETQTRASLAIVTNGLDEMTARKARLEAEREDADAAEFPADFLARQAAEPDVARLIKSEQRLFELRKTARTGQKSQLKERIAQLHEEIEGLKAQTEAKTKEIELIQVELKGVRKLWDKDLVPVTRLKSLERDAARLEGERGALIAGVAKAKGRITETELQIIQIDQDMRSEVARELSDVNAKIAEYGERKIAAEDQLERVEIRAPQDGFVHQLSVHTIGGVISPGEPLMLIVPKHDELILEARVAPQEIDQVFYKQRAAVRFPGFNQQTTPELNGAVAFVAADLTQDEKTGLSFYTVRIDISDDEIGRLGDLDLVPGMPAEVFIQTTERTVLSFFLKPLSDQVRRAFRE